MSANNQEIEIIVLLESNYQNLAYDFKKKNLQSSNGKNNSLIDAALQADLEARLFPNMNNFETQKRNLWLSEIYNFEKYLEQNYINFLAQLRAEELATYVDNITKKEKLSYLLELEKIIQISREKQIKLLNEALKDLAKILNEMEKRIDKLLSIIKMIEKENTLLENKIEDNNEKIDILVHDIFHSILDSGAIQDIHIADHLPKINFKDIFEELLHHFREEAIHGDENIANIFINQKTFLEELIKSKIPEKFITPEINISIQKTVENLNNQIQNHFHKNSLTKIATHLMQENSRYKLTIKNNKEKIKILNSELFSLRENQEHLLKFEKMMVDSRDKRKTSEKEVLNHLAKMDTISKVCLNNQKIGAILDETFTKEKQHTNVNEERKIAPKKSSLQLSNENDHLPLPYHVAASSNASNHNPPPYNPEAFKQKASDAWISGPRSAANAHQKNSHPDHTMDNNSDNNMDDDAPPKYSP